MATSLQDAKIQVTLDTKEAERALRNLDKKAEIEVDLTSKMKLEDPRKRKKGLYQRFMRHRLQPTVGGVAAAAGAVGVGAAAAGVAAFKGAEFGLPAITSIVAAELEKAAERGGERSEQLAAMVKAFDEKVSAFSQKLSGISNEVFSIKDAMSAVSTAASLQAGVGVPLNVDFFTDLGLRNYDISVVQGGLAAEVKKVAQKNVGRFVAGGMVDAIRSGM